MARFRHRCSHKFRSLASILLDKYSLRSRRCRQLRSCRLSSQHKFRYRSRDPNSSRYQLRSCKLSSRHKFHHNSRDLCSIEKGQGNNCKCYNQRCSHLLDSRGPSSSRDRKCRCSTHNLRSCQLDNGDHCSYRKQAMLVKGSCSPLDFSKSHQDTDLACRRLCRGSCSLLNFSGSHLDTWMKGKSQN